MPVQCRHLWEHCEDLEVTSQAGGTRGRANFILRSESFSRPTDWHKLQEDYNGEY